MKIIFSLFICCLITSLGYGQQNVLLIGNTDPICFPRDSIEIVTSKKLPERLDSFNAVFIFSTAESILSSKDLALLEEYLTKGGGIYCGAENWPLQAESKLLTMHLYHRECWGNFDNVYSKSEGTKATNAVFSETDSFPSGKTTVAFPLDYRLKVEVWIDDQPLILSGKYGKGKIILDGGYSRFYCEGITEDEEKIFGEILRFLVVPPRL